MAEKIQEIKLNPEKVAFCRFKKLGDKYLVTNDIGRYVFLKPEEFKQYMEGNLDENSQLYQKLEEEEFMGNSLDRESLVERYRQRNGFLFIGPTLHIVVVTLRCNYRCVYCQASSEKMDSCGFDMDIKTAKKVVDTIFRSPSDVITIEFQGGEPLANWPTVKFIVEYTKKLNKKAKKRIFITLVSNLSLLTEERYKFLIKNHISPCTSLDGPRELHNNNRPFVGGDSYKTTVSWIKKIIAREKKDKTLYRLSALLTVTRKSLKKPKEIINEYIKLGFSGLHLRPLSFLGLSGKMEDKIGYTAEEFLKFWQKSMDYIITLNLKGKTFAERSSMIMLRKILTDVDPNFLDLRSPCGAGIGQMLYNYDGKVFTCDEGRMIGDDTFVIGNIAQNSYREIVSHETVRSCCMASLLDNLSCDNCVYKPYCGVCPVINYALYGDIFASLPYNERCKLFQGMLDYLFKKIQDKKSREVFEKWLKLK